MAVLVVQGGIEVWLAIEHAHPVAPKLTDTPLAETLVRRPEKLNEVVEMLAGRPSRPVGITATTSLTGAGGFGKTTLASMVRQDPRIHKMFPDGSLQVTLGQGVLGPALANKINDAAERLTGGRPGYVDPETAGTHLMGLLRHNRRRLLLVIDDVWAAEQLAPFRSDVSRCALLVTTRVAEVLPFGSGHVDVDQMSFDQARQMLTGTGAGLPASLVDDLAQACGRWPLLLALVAGRLRATMAQGGDPVLAGERTLLQIAEEGPASLDVVVGNDRTRAVSVNVNLSVDLLPGGGRDRFLELGVFPEDTPIPIDVIARLWAATAGLTARDSQALCQLIGQLSLAQYRVDANTLELHDVIRAHLRAVLAQRLPQVQGTFLDSVSRSLPTTRSLASGGADRVAWWALPSGDSYLWDHLAQHIAEAGRPDEFDATIADLRWVAARLLRSGPSASVIDLTANQTPRSASLGRLLSRAAPLLTELEPPQSIVDVLLSRAREEPRFRPEVDRWQRSTRRAHLAAVWPMPDEPEQSMRRVLTAHTGEVTATGIAPNGKWIATGSRDGSVRTWDPVTGRGRLTMRHAGAVTAVAISPDGTWLASVGEDRSAVVWDGATGEARATAKGHRGAVRAVRIACDGSWLATASDDRSVRIWDPVTGHQKSVLTGHASGATSLATGADPAWLVAGSADGVVRFWNPLTGTLRRALPALPAPVWCLAMSVDGTAVAIGGGDGTILIWDLGAAAARATITGHAGAVWSVAFAPDGTWLASAGADGTVRMWDARSGAEVRTLTSRGRPVRSVSVAPDGAWLVTGGDDQAVRVWDAAPDRDPAEHGTRMGAVTAVSFAPDGTWLASGGADGTIRLWDVPARTVRTEVGAFDAPVLSLGIPDHGRWVTAATSGRATVWDLGDDTLRDFRGAGYGRHSAAVASDGTVVAAIDGWDDAATSITRVDTGTVAIRLRDHPRSLSAMAVAPDRAWMATGAGAGQIQLWHRDGESKAVCSARSSAGFVRSLAISPHGAWLAAGTEDGVVRLLSEAGRELAALPERGATNASVAIAPDGAWFVTGAGSVLRVWESATYRCVASLRLGSSINACAWSPNGELIAVGGQRGLYLFAFAPPR